MGLKAYWNVWVLRKMPVVVYAAGRVGSVSMLNALRRAGVFSFKVEFFDHRVLTSSKFCKRQVLESNKPAKFIVLVRDPVEVLYSLYFSKLVRGHIPKATAAFAAGEVSKLVEFFHTEILETDYIPTYLHWFETEFAPHLNFSIFDKPFNPSDKSTQFSEGRFDFLVLRTDLPDTEKEQQVKKFLDIDTFALKRENEKSSSEHATLYTAFKRELKITPDKLDMIYTSPYAQHFFSAEEIAVMRQRWD